MFPCILCGTLYTPEDVGELVLITTGVCLICYAAGRAAPSSQWCFGKPEKYDADAAECRELCPDRKICNWVVTGKVKLAG